MYMQLGVGGGGFLERPYMVKEQGAWIQGHFVENELDHIHKQILENIIML